MKKEMLEIFWMLSTVTVGKVLMTFLRRYMVRGCNHGSKNRKAHSLKDVVGPTPLSTGETGGILQFDGIGKCNVSICGTGCNGFQQ